MSGHHHHHDTKNLKLSFFLNLGFAIIEVVGGIWTNSVAILSDALHDFGDSLTIGLSWYFAKLSKKGRDDDFSYGYRRFNVIGAIISSIVLVTGSVFIVIESIPRLLNPVQPDTSGMIALGILGVLVNGAAALRLKSGESVNEQAVYWHLLEDVLGWTATLIGAIIMHFTNVPELDAVLSILIALFILYNVVRNLKRSFKIILQGTPTEIDIEKIHKTLSSVDGVSSLHDCHTWTMDGQYHILSVHLVVNDQSLNDLQEIKEKVKGELKTLGINHSTIEFESKDEDCDSC